MIKKEVSLDDYIWIDTTMCCYIVGIGRATLGTYNDIPAYIPVKIEPIPPNYIPDYIYHSNEII